MRGSYSGMYTTPDDRTLWCVCPTNKLPPGRYKRLGDTEEGVWLLKDVKTGQRHLLAGGDEKHLKWEPEE